MASNPGDTLRKVDECLKPFDLSLEKLQKISALLEENFVKGLGRDTHSRAKVKMLPTYIMDTPDRTENGEFLALDLGGTNLRVFYVKLPGEEQKMDSKEIEEMKKKSGEELFDFIADFLGQFLVSEGLEGRNLPLGFSFSFPCRQTAIDKSFLIKWTKGFDCSGVVDEDVVQLLRGAIRRRGLHTSVSQIAILNDTVGTMMSCAYTAQNNDQKCDIGLIVGTGTNACYMEEMRNVERVEGDTGRMCINTEWGNFGDLEDFKTEFDTTLDSMSTNRGEQIFEKMISGKYLGEIVRLVLVKMTEEGLLFEERASELLKTKDEFKSKFISKIEEKDTDLKDKQKILTDLGLRCDEVDVEAVRRVCEAVSTRAAGLCGAALATLATRIRVSRNLEKLKTTVAVDGAVYEKHPNFKEKLKETVLLLAPDCEISYQLQKDGSGKGAALTAAVVQRWALQPGGQ